mgnify:CR=1 FL=1
MRKPLIAGNWKMNLNHLEAIAVTQKLAYSLEDRDYDAVEVVIIPPFTDIRSVQTLVDGDRLRLVYGAQDLSIAESGAYTGEISGSMLSKLGCTYVLVGHSERRANHAESDQIVNKKIKAALANELKPILCIGEELPIREAGNHIPYVLEQLRNGLKGFHKPDLKKIVFAYEPVWAIGTGLTPTTAEVAEVHAHIRKELESIMGTEGMGTRILYGGSVKANNVAGFLKSVEVDGVLVGGASLDADEFSGIARFQKHIVL